MTDEEKALEIICNKCSDDINKGYTHCLDCTRCDDFIKGFAEGRKEFEAQVEQLSNDNHVLKTSFITQQEQIEKLKSHCKAVDDVNAKMKNCSNCNGIINGIRQEKCKFCMRSKLLSEWELAE